MKQIWGDIKRKYYNDLGGDFEVVDGDLALDAGMETSVVISLMTDRRADTFDELPDPQSTDRKGWWGDSLGGVIGSKLWLRYREKQLRRAMLMIKEDAQAALEWLRADRVAAKTDIRVSNPDLYNVRLMVDVYQPHGKEKISYKYDLNWQEQAKMHAEK